MKQFCLVVTRDGHIDEVLVRLPTIANEDDIKEAINFAVDNYFADLEGV